MHTITVDVRGDEVTELQLLGLTLSRSEEEHS